MKLVPSNTPTVETGRPASKNRDKNRSKDELNSLTRSTASDWNSNKVSTLISLEGLQRQLGRQTL